MQFAKSSNFRADRSMQERVSACISIRTKEGARRIEIYIADTRCVAEKHKARIVK